jgi:hypothetical protein
MKSVPILASLLPLALVAGCASSESAPAESSPVVTAPTPKVAGKPEIRYYMVADT